MATINIQSSPGPGKWRAKPASIAPAKAQPLQALVIATPVVAVLYNALLALLAVRGVPVNEATAVGCEILIIIAALAVSAVGGFSKNDAFPLGYLYLTGGLTIMMCMVQQRVSVDALRNVLIIAGFTLLGGRATERSVRIVFAVCVTLMLAVLIWEILSVESYAAAFRPADYLSKTRGYTVKEFYEDVGLMVGTIAYEGRFSFGIFTGPRTSSIMLEQVGINCFVIVLMVYMSTMWGRLSLWERVLCIATTILIILSNNARMAALLVPVLTIGYFLFPRLPRYLNAAVPILLLTFTIILFQFEQPRIGDDFVGRIGVTYQYLTKLQASDLLIGNLKLMRRAFDTGYGYIITSATIFGALAYWAYLTFAVPQSSIASRRAVWSMNAYIYLWLLVGGTASFSMKTASLLWFLMGFVRANIAAEPATNDTPPKALGAMGGRWRSHAIGRASQELGFR